jgi:molecular chaperone GrpE
VKEQGDNPERIDIDLDSEPIAESPLDAVRAEAAAPEAITQDDALKALAMQLAQLQAQKDELYQTLIRRQADFENYRKRIDRERKDDSVRAVAIFAEAFLPVLDAFERALSADSDPAYQQYREGFELIYKQMMDSLGRLGLAPIEAVGKPFDPFYHQAVERVETDAAEDGTVLEQLQRGYRLKDKVLRPAMVKVAARRDLSG